MRYLKSYQLFECNVCSASMLIDGKILSKTLPNGDVYEIKGTAEGEEFKPGVYQLRKNNGEWSKEFKTEDLAGEVSRGFFDIKGSSEQSIKWLENHF